MSYCYVIMSYPPATLCRTQITILTHVFDKVIDSSRAIFWVFVLFCCDLPNHSFYSCSCQSRSLVATIYLTILFCRGWFAKSSLWFYDSIFPNCRLVLFEFDFIFIILDRNFWSQMSPAVKLLFLVQSNPAVSRIAKTASRIAKSRQSYWIDGSVMFVVESRMANPGWRIQSRTTESLSWDRHQCD